MIYHSINYRILINSKYCISICYIFKIILSFIIIFNSNYHAQSLDSIKLAYLDSLAYKNHKIISLTKEKNSWKWLSIAPNISVSNSWDPFTQVYKPMVNVNFSLSNISNFLQNNARNRIEREKLIIQLNDNLINQELSIDNEILEIQKDSTALSLDEKNIKLLQDLLSIKSRQYQDNKINLEEKINFEITINNKIKDYEINKINLINRRKKLMYKLTKKSL